MRVCCIDSKIQWKLYQKYGELIIQLGLLDLEGDLIDWETDLEAPDPEFIPESPETDKCPPNRSCHLHRCRLAAPLLALGPASVQRELR